MSGRFSRFCPIFDTLDATTLPPFLRIQLWAIIFGL